jgi:two-component system sensor kinase FixL
MVTDRSSVSRGLQQRPLLAGLLAFACYLAVGGAELVFVHRLGTPTAAAAETVIAPWIAEGIALVALLLGGLRLWPAVFAGSLLLWTGLHRGPAVMAVVAAGAEVVAVVGIVRLLRLWGFEHGLRRFRDPLLLLGAASVGCSLAGVLDVGGLFACAWLDPAVLDPGYRGLLTDAGGSFPVATRALLAMSLNWVLNSVAGIVLVVPALTTSARPLGSALRERPVAFWVWAGLLALWCVAVLSLPGIAPRLPLMLAALLLIVAAATKLGVVATAIGTLVIALVLAVGAGLGLGAVAFIGMSSAREIIWSVIGLLVLTGLTLAALMEERRLGLQELAAVADRYRRLFDGNPVAIFVSDAPTGRILLSNGAAHRQFGYDSAALARMSIGELLGTPGAAPAWSRAEAHGTPVVPVRTRSGSIREVAWLSRQLELDGAPAEVCYAIDVTARNNLRRQLLAAADIERARLAQELHDGLGQLLTALGMGAHALARHAERGRPLNHTDLRFVETTTAEAVKVLGQLSQGVSPLAASDGDLVAALQRLPESLPPDTRARTTVTVERSADIALPLEGREHLYRVAQEAVNNALKHSGAETFRLAISIDRDTVRMTVADDGVGLRQGAEADSGMGLRSMALRAQALGGELTLSSPPSGGTVLTCSCPQHREEPAPAALPAAAVRVPPALAAAAPARAPGHARTALESLGLAVACVGGALVTHTLLSSSGSRLGMATPQLAVPSLLAGLCAAALLIRGKQLWPGIFAAVTFVDVFLWRLPWSYSLLNAGASVLTALAIVALLEAWQLSRRFDHWRDPLVLCAAAALCWLPNDLITGFILVGLARLEPGAVGEPYRSLMSVGGSSTPQFTLAFLGAVTRWWLDATAGVCLVVPAIAAVPPVWQLVHGRHLETGAWSACLLLWSISLYTGFGPHAMILYLMPAIALVVWAAIRFGVALATAGTFLFAMVAASCFVLGKGLAAMAGAVPPLVSLWAFVGVLTLLSLGLTALLAERVRSWRAVESLGERYRRLFAVDPHPVYVCARDSGRILVVNTAALAVYGYSAEELVGRSCRDLEAGGGRAEPLPAVAGSCETRHITQQGRSFEIELSSVPIDLDGQRATLCFVLDLTERNALRRGLFEATDVERRRLASELRRRLGGLLEDVSDRLQQLLEAPAAGGGLQAIARSIESASRDAGALCRAIAHRASPLLAHGGDLVAALADLATELSTEAGAEFSIRLGQTAELRLPPADREHLYELVREAAIDAAASAGTPAIVLSLDIDPALVRVEIAAANGARSDRRPAALPGVRLRALAMGARLWERELPDGGTALVCECPQAA